jgi:hypothetical protein
VDYQTALNLPSASSFFNSFLVHSKLSTRPSDVFEALGQGDYSDQTNLTFFISLPDLRVISGRPLQPQ